MTASETASETASDARGPASGPTPAASLRDARFAVQAAELGHIAAKVHAAGWTPATSSNFSFRIDGGHCAVTASGRDKSRLDADDLLIVDLGGRVAEAPEGARPSAETGLHTALYRRDPAIGAVLHVHSPRAVLAPMFLARDGRVVISGYELLKAFDGVATHAGSLSLPVVPNSQDIATLADVVDGKLDALYAEGSSGGSSFGRSSGSSFGPWAYLIEGHGVYVWGPDLSSTARHLEALDYLLGLELERHRLTGAARA